jgi:hypothetical protein
VSDNHFLENGLAPDQASIGAALGERYPLYLRILDSAPGFEREWKHYGRKYGWKLKVHDGEKALLELTIAETGILVSVAAREGELLELRSDQSLAALLAELSPPGARKEGWGIRLAIVDEGSCLRAETLIAAIAKIRLSG